jgi:hypothetical protein
MVRGVQNLSAARWMRREAEPKFSAARWMRREAGPKFIASRFEA